MKEKQLLTFRRGDAVAIAAVILFAAILLLFFLPSTNEENSKKVVRIYMDGSLVHEMPLERNGEFQVSGQYINRILIRDGKVAITESSCPGEDCVHSGWINQKGRSIVCLPNRTEVRVEGGSVQEVDAVVQ